METKKFTCIEKAHTIRVYIYSYTHTYIHICIRVQVEGYEKGPVKGAEQIELSNPVQKYMDFPALSFHDDLIRTN